MELHKTSIPKNLSLHRKNTLSYTVRHTLYTRAELIPPLHVIIHEEKRMRKIRFPLILMSFDAI